MKLNLAYCMVPLLVGVGACQEIDTSNPNATINPNEELVTVLDKSMLFYEAQRAGEKETGDHLWRLTWPKNSVLDDGQGEYFFGDGTPVNGIEKRDLSKGLFDAGDHVKFNLPMSFTSTVLAWSLLESPKAYQQISGNYDVPEVKPGSGLTIGAYGIDHLRFVSDYLMNIYSNGGTPENLSDDYMVYQVADGDRDHSFDGPAHEINYTRKMFVCSTAVNQGCTASAAESAASLAAIAMVLQANGTESKFTTYEPATLIEQAELYLRFAESMKNDLGYNKKASPFYTSGKFEDELGWAAIWLYRASGKEDYLAKAIKYIDPNLPGWAFSWEEKTAGAQILIARALRNKSEYAAERAAYDQSIRQHLLINWAQGKYVDRTPDGLFWRIEWGSLRYAMNTAFLASLYAGDLDDVESKEALIDFARSQVAYALGKNARQGSYVVGHGENSPKEPHHRSAAGSAGIFKAQAGSLPFQHSLIGALVGGPVTTKASAWEDGSYWKDDRQDYISNEVATDYNAGFTGVLAELIDIN